VYFTFPVVAFLPWISFPSCIVVRSDPETRGCLWFQANPPGNQWVSFCVPSSGFFPCFFPRRLSFFLFQVVGRLFSFAVLWPFLFLSFSVSSLPPPISMFFFFFPPIPIVVVPAKLLATGVFAILPPRSLDFLFINPVPRAPSRCTPVFPFWCGPQHPRLPSDLPCVTFSRLD